MSTAIALPEPPEIRAAAMPRLLEEDWQEREVECPSQRPRHSAAIRAAKWASILGLLVLGGLWSRVTPFEVAARFMVDAGAIVLMARALLARRYAAVAVAAALVLLYNPLAPLFEVSGVLQRALLVAGAAPFLAFLIWRDMKTVQPQLG